ncbi:HD-GYP domain-containing protein [Candidatus Methylobacter oryzae]|uniref:HD-GYP domain-containing protein n=1 Tax=Candidatus Methylobacter oryzae TaxID=2497749 RepID=A0ABY3CDJ6_9GAMM|nr:HD-GYP domain-containing protein [Candidatus Methylobacter oryzae]TRW98093.1 HD-GYP domain-containing protein [Candidatus Methylobacter oryzae]
MIKKIDVSDLCPDMYIHDINCGWMEHTFLRNRFFVKNQSDINSIVSLGIRHVYIDTSRGLDVPEAPSAEKVHQQLEAEIQNLGKTLKRSVSKQASMHEEIVKARRIFTEACSIVGSVLHDCRLGRQVELEKLEPVITTITDSIFRNPDAIISLLKIKRADKYTFQHSVAVSTLLISFCRAMEIDRSDIELVGIGGLLHDIGKMKVPERILNKPGKLTESEFEVMKNHVNYGCALLETIPNLSPVSVSIVAEHHERHDGSGYPLKLKSDEISLYGQMAAIVDVYDALTSNRVYHNGNEPTEVLKKMLEWSEHHFSPPLVHHFIRTIGIYPVGTLVRLESGYLAVVIEQHHDDLLRPKVRLIFNSKTLSYIQPWDYDLSKPDSHDRISGFELPSRWRINPANYI